MEEEDETDSEESESDNEDVEVGAAETVKKSDDVNFDEKFEKIVPFKFKRLSEESIDEVDHEIAQILHEASPLETELKTAIEVAVCEKKVAENLKKNSEKVFDKEENFNQESLEENSRKFLSEEILTEEDLKENLVKENLVEETLNEIDEKHKNLQPEALQEENSSTDVTAPDEHKSSNTDLERKAAEATADTQSREIEGEEKPSSIADVKEDSVEGLSPKETKESVDDKPQVPIPTYLWEDLKRAKEQVSGDHVCTSICSALPSKRVLRQTSFTLSPQIHCQIFLTRFFSGRISVDTFNQKAFRTGRGAGSHFKL